MLDFLEIETRKAKSGREVYPAYIVGKSNDLMTRGSDFYAIYDEETKMWSTDEDDAIRMIDAEVKKFIEENKDRFDEKLKPMYLRKSSSKMIDQFHQYCKSQCRENYHQLDEVLIFSNTDIKKRSYATKSLPYALEEGTTEAWDELISTLYAPEERLKIEWAIGAIVSGDSRKLQKFLVFYGAAGTGKSTILNVIQKLFEGYYAVFDAKALGSNGSSFALEAFKDNPLVAIQHDGDLSRIEDNTRLNSLISHEEMVVNEKYKSGYSMHFNAFLLMGTNKPVKITDAKSGITRRLIDVTPTGNKIEAKRYRNLVKQIDFELGAIAKHCLDIYKEDPELFDDYVATNMLGATNDFYNYVLDNFDVFAREDGITLKAAWDLYNEYVEDSRIQYPMPKRLFKEELKNYFETYYERDFEMDGVNVMNWYEHFLKHKFECKPPAKPTEEVSWINLTEQPSVFDDICKDCFAQLTTDKETPRYKWDKVKTKLAEIDTRELHYVRVPENHIVIDFDKKDKDGNKSLELNLKAAQKWPRTYAEVSKGGQGLHLHYIYGDDVSKLANLYEEDVEIKVFMGNSSLRRRLSLCNDLPIAVINSGLPFRKEKKKMVDIPKIKSEDKLKDMIMRNMSKEFHPGTKPSIDFINTILNEAYEEKSFSYDLSGMRNAVYAFAAGSTNQAEYCIKVVNNMKFKSEDMDEKPIPYVEDKILFYDVEVYPNLFIIVYKAEGDGEEPVIMINPKPIEVENLCKFKLVGFNCRRYDNHILRARIMGFSNEQLYLLSQNIINGVKGSLNPGAYDVSYTDIYDFSSKKQSLKKFEIELGIHHQEMGIPWDQPVPEELWDEVAQYCVNDVLATEAVWNARKADFTARQVLADLADMTVNDSTNSLTTRIIFGKEKRPQIDFNYRKMGDVSEVCTDGYTDEIKEKYPDVKFDNTLFDANHRPIFPGYEFDMGKSKYWDVDEVGEGGYVYSEPGMYGNVALLDIASMHPSSVVAEQLFGEEYTERFSDILNARIAIKHKDFDKARTMLNGKLAPYLTDESKSKELAQALKIAINSVYGLTSAKFENPFRDPRNLDNIVAKRGALFMINLRHAVQDLGYTVAHIKTDSIKIPDATPEIIQFVMDYGKLYGYNFEHEATYDRMTLVNDAVYIAKYATPESCQELYGYVPDECMGHGGQWTATGTEFQVPYIFKTVFSKEPIEFEDLCETKSVSQGLMYLDLNEELPDVTELEKEFKKTGDENLLVEIDKGHSYQFVGKVGSFCPIKDGYGGGALYREKDGKYYAVAGTKGYKWLEAEYVRNMGLEDAIDMSYFDALVKDAIQDVVAYGNYDWFISDEPYVSPPFKGGCKIPAPIYLEEIPFH